MINLYRENPEEKFKMENKDPFLSFKTGPFNRFLCLKTVKKVVKNLDPTSPDAERLLNKVDKLIMQNWMIHNLENL